MRFRRREEGSIVLEAALVLPIFLCFLVFLITMIRIATVEIALNNAVSNATKQVSAHMYPIAVLMDDFNRSDTGNKANEYLEKMNHYRDQIIEVEQGLDQSPLQSLFPKEVKSLLSIRHSFESGVIGAYDRSLRTVFEPLVDYYIDDSIIRIEKFQVTKVTLPSLKNRDHPYFGLELRYDMPLHIPFFNKELTFKKKSYERVWVGDANTTVLERGKAAGSGEEDEKEGSDTEASDGDPRKESDAEDEPEPEEEEEDDKLVIDSISSPVQRGKNVTIIAKGPPNSTITITLLYQSGFVKSETCKTDATGWMNCSIKIGPNSNEGLYEAILTVDDQEAKGTFEVLSKANMDKYIQERKGRARE